MPSSRAAALTLASARASKAGSTQQRATRRAPAAALVASARSSARRMSAALISALLDQQRLHGLGQQLPLVHRRVFEIGLARVRMLMRLARGVPVALVVTAAHPRVLPGSGRPRRTAARGASRAGSSQCS